MAVEASSLVQTNTLSSCWSPGLLGAEKMKMNKTKSPLSRGIDSKGKQRQASRQLYHHAIGTVMGLSPKSYSNMAGGRGCPVQAGDARETDVCIVINTLATCHMRL